MTTVSNTDHIYAECLYSGGNVDYNKIMRANNHFNITLGKKGKVLFKVIIVCSLLLVPSH